jgi:ketosteroid isomerase-like protein
MTNEEEVIRVENDLLQAMLKSDVNELDRLISDQLTFAAHTGGIFSKKDDLEAHRSGMIKIECITASDRIIKVFEDFAVVFVLLNIKGSFFGELSEGNFRFSRVWMKEGDGLKIVSGHSTKIDSL